MLCYESIYCFHSAVKTAVKDARKTRRRRGADATAVAFEVPEAVSLLLKLSSDASGDFEHVRSIKSSEIGAWDFTTSCLHSVPDVKVADICSIKGMAQQYKFAWCEMDKSDLTYAMTTFSLER